MRLTSRLGPIVSIVMLRKYRFDFTLLGTASFNRWLMKYTFAESNSKA